MATDARQDKFIEALSIGADTWLAAEASSVRMEEYNRWINDPDPVKAREWKARVIDAESTGRFHKNRIEQMRSMVSKHDEAWVILMKQAEHFKEFKKKQSGGVQMGLLS